MKLIGEIEHTVLLETSHKILVSIHPCFHLIQASNQQDNQVVTHSCQTKPTTIMVKIINNFDRLLLTKYQILVPKFLYPVVTMHLLSQARMCIHQARVPIKVSKCQETKLFLSFGLITISSSKGINQ